MTRRPALGDRKPRPRTCSNARHPRDLVPAANGRLRPLLPTLEPSRSTRQQARHYPALPELVTITDLLAIVPTMYARPMVARWPVRVWALPGDASGFDVRMVWHATATPEPAHQWLREPVRQLFARRGAQRRSARAG